MIKNIIFDIGFVLVDFRWRALMQDLGLPKELQDVFDKTVFGSSWWSELDLGAMDEADVLEKLREQNKDYLEELDLIWANMDKVIEPYPYAVSWIEGLKEKGYNVYLLSNYPKELFAMHEQKGLFPFIEKTDGKVVSGFVKMVKPNADIYEHLMSKYGLNAEECVFLDDRAENIEAAIKLGMKGIVVKSYEQASADLNRVLGF